MSVHCQPLVTFVSPAKKTEPVDMPLRGADSGILDEVDIHTGRAILGLSGPFRNALRVTVSLYAAKKSITALQRRHCCSGLQCHRLVGVTLHRRPTYEKSATL